MKREKKFKPVKHIQHSVKKKKKQKKKKITAKRKVNNKVQEMDEMQYRNI